ncbi:MAG: arginase family protein [Promethearchaeota archaeon]
MPKEEITFKGGPKHINTDSNFAIFGVPYDGNSSQWWGQTYNAPKMIRFVSNHLAYSSEGGDDFNLIRFGDLGNINIGKKSFHNKIERKIRKKIDEIFDINHSIIPVVIGGNHYISYPVFSSLRSIYSTEPISFISFDAHLDFYDVWEKKKHTHCTVTKRIFELENMGSNQVFVIGARDIDLPELKLAKKTHLKYLTVKQFFDNKREYEYDFKKYIQKSFNGEFFGPSENNGKRRKLKAYISIDIDVLDPAFAPGTAYPIPGGISFRDLIQSLEYIAEKFEIIGFDLVEYAPNLDPKSRMTGFLAAKIISEFMMKIIKLKLEKIV